MKDQKKKLPLNDQLEYRDPQVLAEYSPDIYKSMLREEVKYMVDPNYLQKV